MYFWEALSDHGETPALITEGQSLSYAQLAARADGFAEDIRQRLPAAVSRPLVLLEAVNAPAPVIAYLGALRAGWPVILVAEGTAGVESDIRRTYAPNVIIRAEGQDIRAEIAAPDPVAMHPDLAVLLSTSGTTGAAKLVRLSAQNLQANAGAIASYLGVRPDDRAITALPFHYSYGMSVLHIHLLCGAGLVLTEGSLVEPAFRALARREGVTSLALVPTQFEFLDSTDWVPRLRYITQAGGRLDPVLARRFAERAAREGWQLFIMYGQTEAGPRMSYLPPEDAADWFHTIGRPIPGGTFRLIDASGAGIDGPDLPGELVYEGPNVMLGYATARADLAAPAGPPVLHTGDIAERLENGYFRIVGRASRFIKLFGLRIGLDEVETRLRSAGHRVYASGTDARLVLFVQGAAGLSTLRREVAASLKLPETAVLAVPLDEVPLLASGKVDHRALARRAEALVEAAKPGQTTGATGVSGVSGATGLAALLKTALRTPEPDLGLSFLGHGGDSLSYLEVQLYLSGRLGHVPAGWEQMPLRDLLALDADGAAQTPPAGALQAVSADLLARIVAIFAVIALHSTTWSTGGGSYLLLVLAGYSLARFQGSVLFDGRVLQTWRSMLMPLLIVYFLLIGGIALFWAPVDPALFALVENFTPETEPEGLTPYWFVSTYTQAILLAGLPFLWPPLRHQIARQPLGAGLAALAASATILPLGGLDEIPYWLRHHHPVPALQLLLLGWCGYAATRPAQRVLVTAATLAIWALCWRDAPAGISAMMLAGTLAVVWGMRVPLPVAGARALMRVGSLTLFLYLLHVPVTALILRRWPNGPDALHYIAVIGLTLIAAALCKIAYDRLAGLVQSRLSAVPAAGPSG